MPAILLPDRWRIPPTSAVAARPDYAAGVVWSPYAAVAGLDHARQIVGVNSGLSATSGRFGRALVANASGHAYVAEPRVVSSGWLAMLALVRNTNTAQRNTTFFGLTSTASNNPLLTVGVHSTSNAIAGYARNDANTGLELDPALTTTDFDGEWGLVGWRALIGGTYVEYFSRGRLVSTRTRRVDTGTYTFNRVSIGAMVRASVALQSTGEIALGIFQNRWVSDGEMAELAANPFLVFSKQPRTIYFNTAGGATIAGAFAATESGSDTASLAGDVLVQGALASTESGSDTAALTGDVLVQGALSATETGSDTASATGLVLVQGSLAATETGSDTAAFLGAGAAASITGTMAATESGSDTAAVTGLVLIQGGLSSIESGSDSAAVTGLVLVQGGLAATESGADTAAISGTSAVISTGALAATESGADTASVTGLVLIQGGLSVTESGSDTASVSGDVLVTGTLAATESGSDTADISSFRPRVPGIEYTLPSGRLHYTLPASRAHYTIAA